VAILRDLYQDRWPVDRIGGTGPTYAAGSIVGVRAQALSCEGPAQRRTRRRKGDALRGLRAPVVIGVLFAVLWIVGTAATAQTTKPKYPPITPSVLPSVLTPAPTPTIPSEQPTSPPSVEPSRQPRDPLPFTGADLTRFVVVGAGLALGGSFLVRVARRSRAGS
jgi:hypothetical protein